MVGLHYLKHAFNLSGEALLDRWVENPYWQHFCGFDTMQHEPPIHSTTMTKWRERIGADTFQILLQETIVLALEDRHISEQELKHVNVDTTVQEKNITYPTDSKLYYKALVKLAKVAKQLGIPLRQTYLRVGKQAAIRASRYAHAKQFRRMRRELRFLRNRLGRVIRDIRRQVPVPTEALEQLLALCERLQRQQREDKHKLYSLHEPEVVCISKGKAHKRYEFGQKVTIATSNRGNWILGIGVMPGNPYDGHTLTHTIELTERTTGVTITDAYVDKGYVGHRHPGSAKIHIAGSNSRGLTRLGKKRRRRRSAIEPKIGHLKSDHRMGRCFLHGLHGDAINATLAAAGSNLLKLLRAIAHALIFWLWWRPAMMRTVAKWPT
jgi:IS5 family transposase